MNKTGTTSLEAFMKMHGYTCGDQVKGEFLMSAYAKNDWAPIFEFCETAEFFQDLPFSAPKTFENLTEAFPDARYILTLRDSAEEWYDSLVRFHERVFGTPLNRKTLIGADYRYQGYAWEVNRLLYRSPEENPYRKADLIEDYQDHIERVRTHFSNQNNFLEINLKEENAVEKLSRFLEIEPQVEVMPWLNKSAEA
jgi:hypothetical protein